MPGSGHRNELQLELSGRSQGNATTFRDRRVGLDAFPNHGFAVRALLLGAYRSVRFRYFDHSGTGFSEKGLKDGIDRLKPLFID